MKICHFFAKLCGAVFIIRTFFVPTEPLVAQPVQQSESAGVGQEESLPSLVEVLLINNQKIQAAKAKILASKERIIIAKSWSDPMLGFMVVPNPTEEMEMIVGAKNIEVSQMIPLGNKDKQAGRMATTRVEMDKAQFQVVVFDQLEALKTAYEEVSYLDDAVNIIEENRQILDQISGMTIARSSTPAILSEIQRIQSQLSQIGFDTSLLKELRIAEQARVNALLNRPIEQPLAVIPICEITAPVASFVNVLKQLGETHPDLRMASLAIQMAKQEKSMARKERIPDVTVGYSQQRDRNWKVDFRGDTYKIDLNLPLWGSKNRARIKEAGFKASEAEAELTATRQNLSSDITAQYVRIQNLWRTIRIYEDSLLPQSKHALENAQANRSKVSEILPEALEAQAVWLNFRLAHRRALADYRQANARLDTLIGKAPEVREEKSE
ncbi:MAG: TolC family protein [Candidatus Ozemobacteraceae bacterium]